MLKIILLFLCYLAVLEKKNQHIVLWKKFSHIIYVKYYIYYTVEDLYDFNLLEKIILTSLQTKDESFCCNQSLKL